MSEYITQIQTTDGPKQIDYNALGNLPDLGVYATKTSVDNTINNVKSEVKNDINTLNGEVIKVVNGVSPDDNGQIWLDPEGIGAATINHTHTPESIGAATAAHDHDTWSVEKGGTGATNAADARNNLEITPANIGAAVVGPKYVAQFPYNNWTDNVPYTNTVEVWGMLSSDTPIIDLSFIYIEENAGIIETYKEQWGYIDKIVAGDGTLTAYAYSMKPTLSLNFNFMTIR